MNIIEIEELLTELSGSYNNSINYGINIPEYIKILSNPLFKTINDIVNNFIENNNPKLFEDNILINTSFNSSSSISTTAGNGDNIVFWLLDRCKETSAFEAIEDLKSWVSRDRVKGYHSILSIGPKLKQTIIIDDITISPLSKHTDKNIYKSLNYNLSNNVLGSGVNNVCAIVLTKEFEISKIEQKVSCEDNIKNRKKENKLFEKMEDIIRVISIINESLYYNIKKCSLMENEISFNNGYYKDTMQDACFDDWLSKKKFEIQLAINNDNYQEIFNDLWIKWNSLDEKIKNKIRISIDRWNSSLHRGNLKNKLIELRIAIEALIIKDDREKDKTYYITNRIKKMYDDEELTKKVKKLYNFSSRVIHDGYLSTNDLKKNPITIIEEIQKEFPNMVKNIINNGIPNIKKPKKKEFKFLGYSIVIKK